MKAEKKNIWGHCVLIDIFPYWGRKIITFQLWKSVRKSRHWTWHFAFLWWGKCHLYQKKVVVLKRMKMATMSVLSTIACRVSILLQSHNFPVAGHTTYMKRFWMLLGKKIELNLKGDQFTKVLKIIQNLKVTSYYLKQESLYDSIFFYFLFECTLNYPVSTWCFVLNTPSESKLFDSHP